MNLKSLKNNTPLMKKRRNDASKRKRPTKRSGRTQMRAKNTR
jgi:hypothetical protein